MPEFRFPENTVRPEVALLKEEGGLYVYRLTFDAAEPMHNLELSVLLPMKEILSSFDAVIEREPYVHQWFARACKNSSFYFGAPFYTVCDRDRVYANLALSDAVNDLSIRFSINDFDEEEQVAFVVRLLTGQKTMKHYGVDLYLDTRPLLLTDSMKALSDWWLGYYPAKTRIPAAAEEPLYSTWYNFHQHPNAAELVPELTLAKELGFGSVILDDGWQFDGRGTGDYSNCGDWAFSEEKFPDGPVELQALGLPMAVWFCVPFVGWNTKAYQRFKDKLLYEMPSNNCGILDVRYRETRNFITDTLCSFMTRYQLDGLKLDFIDSFTLTPESPEPNDAMDEPDLAKAVIRLLDELTERLTAIRPDALIEFRQNYIGPAITRYGNMLRVGDCAFDSISNRRRLADLRLLHYPMAIHADMVYWAHDESVENISRQLINILFAVPQISVLLTQSTEAQKNVLRSFISYWKANKKTLLHGEFLPQRQEMDYLMLEARDAEKRIIALYAEKPLEIESRTDIFNATETDRQLLELGAACELKVFDAEGTLLPKLSAANLEPGLRKITIPLGGHAELCPVFRKSEWIPLEGLMSSDGSSYGFDFMRGSGADEKNLVLFFNGGGVSYDAHMAARPNDGKAADPLDAYYYPYANPTVNRNGMLCARSGNPFRNWTAVCVPYSTADFHCGDGDFPYVGRDGSSRVMHHHGYRNTMRIIDELKKRLGFEPEKLLISGCSAGAFATAILSDTIIERFPETKDVTVCVDSAVLLRKDWREILQNVWHTPETLLRPLHTDNLTKDCLEALSAKYGSRIKLCYTGSRRDATLVLFSGYDKYGRLKGDAALADDYERGLDELTAALPAMKVYLFELGAFFAPDAPESKLGLTRHCILRDAEAITYKNADGVSVLEWLRGITDSEA